LTASTGTRQIDTGMGKWKNVENTVKYKKIYKYRKI
jgi:hypothetical protein